MVLPGLNKSRSLITDQFKFSSDCAASIKLVSAATLGRGGRGCRRWHRAAEAALNKRFSVLMRICSCIAPAKHSCN